MNKACIMIVAMMLAINTMALKKDPDYRKARHDGAEAQLKVSLVDDQGMFVSNANVRAFMGMNFRPKGYWINGETGSDGVFLLQGKTCGDEIEIFASKEGYYNSKRKLVFAGMGAERDVRNGKWLPYGEMVCLKLRKVNNPVELCKFGFGMGKSVPDTNTWIGVDMMYGDFIHPYGKGEKADFEVLVEWDGHSPIDSNYCAARIRFIPPLSGGYYASRVEESDFPYIYEADKNADYSVSMIKVVDRNRIQKNGVVPFRNDAVLVTRTRCEIGKDGNLRSACYGFIRVFSSDASWKGKPIMRLAGIFNPTPNDTNLEPK